MRLAQVPLTRRDDTVETLHGREVADPYRWLEDPDSVETKAWVGAQNLASRGYLDALPSRAWFHRTTRRIVARRAPAHPTSTTSSPR